MSGAHVVSVAPPERHFPETDLTRALHLWNHLFDAATGEPASDDMKVAEELIGLAQGEFARREKGPPASGIHEVRPWVLLQEVAVAVMKKRYGGNGRRAKDAQIRAANGRPLAACVGT